MIVYKVPGIIILILVSRWHSDDYDIIGVLNWFLTYIILYVDQSCAFVSTRKRNGGIPDIYSIPRR
jgi:hypothetical protein